MSYSFEEVLDSANKICDGKLGGWRHDIISTMGRFYDIYPFATENILGYMKYFDLKNKSLLTVGSSGDQAFNAMLLGVKDITLTDINLYTKYYFYLKMTGIIIFEYDEFLEFFRYEDYPKVFKNNYKVFRKDYFNKLKDLLRLLDYESYFFWDELISLYSGDDIRNRMFSRDEDRTYVISESNLYLLNKKNYNNLKRVILKCYVKIINKDILYTDFNTKYDNIWLSNIGTYLKEEELKNLINVYEYLKDNGSLLLCYLFQTDKDSEFKDDYSPIYNLEKVMELFKEYNPVLKSFIGVKGIKFNEERIKDSIILCKKVGR